MEGVPPVAETALGAGQDNAFVVQILKRILHMLKSGMPARQCGLLALGGSMENKKRIERLIAAIETLTPSQVRWVSGVVEQFSKPKKFSLMSNSALMSRQLVDDLGDTFRIHHAFSREPFSKDKFEYALERIAKDNGKNAALAPRGNPGYDIEILGEKFSLKTEAAAKISPSKIHISKFMELGGGQWGSDPADLLGLRQQFFEHMEQYERILVLRKLQAADGFFHYELVEIPKSLLLEARTGEFEMKLDSTQRGAKPGYCYVPTKEGPLKFSLYFDGGGERKLQIKGLDKRLCVVHADWQFEG